MYLVVGAQSLEELRQEGFTVPLCFREMVTPPLMRGISHGRGGARALIVLGASF